MFFKRLRLWGFGSSCTALLTLSACLSPITESEVQRSAVISKAEVMAVLDLSELGSVLQLRGDGRIFIDDRELPVEHVTSQRWNARYNILNLNEDVIEIVPATLIYGAIRGSIEEIRGFLNKYGITVADIRAAIDNSDERTIDIQDVRHLVGLAAQRTGDESLIDTVELLIAQNLPYYEKPQ